MVGVNFFGNFDLASLSIWLFYGFFAALIFYIQRENMREGYPLRDDDGTESANQGPFPVPEDKTFEREHGLPSVTVPSGQRPDRQDLALERTAQSNGFPFEPTGDPMLDGVGPASWANREDTPELDGHGHPKIVPMSATQGFQVTAGNNPIGLQVIGYDKQPVGKVVDLWIDEAEQLVRHLEIELDPKWGSGRRLLPIHFSVIYRGLVRVRSLYAKNFDNIPKNASPRQVTKLEEDKIMAYYGGGTLYADASRLNPQI